MRKQIYVRVDIRNVTSISVHGYHKYGHQSVSLSRAPLTSRTRRYRRKKSFFCLPCFSCLFGFLKEKIAAGVGDFGLQSLYRSRLWQVNGEQPKIRYAGQAPVIDKVFRSAFALLHFDFLFVETNLGLCNCAR